MRNAPDFSCSTAWATGSWPAASAALHTSSGLVASWGELGSQPMRSARTLKSISWPVHWLGSASGERMSLTLSRSYFHCPAWA